MYHLINSHIEEILQSIRQDHVTDYDFLVQNIDRLQTPFYQAAYKNYWRLNVARLCDDFCRVYFDRLQSSLRDGVPQIGELVKELHETPTHEGGRKSLQFSFCSKLCHMIDRQIPLYDSRIRNFYFYTEPDRKLSLQQRVDGYVHFHNFLIEEYRRVLSERLLSGAIQAFRQRFRPKHFADVKVIDSLIWAFTSLSESGGVAQRLIVYC
jgi:hypothetical protein